MGRKIIGRNEWGAKYGVGTPLQKPLKEIVIHTEAGRNRPPRDINSDILWVRAVERYHVVGPLRARGVAYNYLITRAGRIFEGRGHTSGHHTEAGRNRTAVAFCFEGHGDYDDATHEQWAAAEWLVGELIRKGEIKANPIISGHYQYSTKGKTCPGVKIRPHLGRLRGITGPGMVANVPNVPAIAPDEIGLQRPYLRGNDIKHVMSQVHFISGKPVDVDGVWGPKADKAFRDLQRFLGKPETGIVNAEWRKTLDYLVAKKRSEQKIVESERYANQLRQIDAELNKIGWEIRQGRYIKRGERSKRAAWVQILANQRGTNPRLPETNFFGSQTLRAVRQLQARHRLNIDGVVGPKTWEMLRGRQ